MIYGGTPSQLAYLQQKLQAQPVNWTWFAPEGWQPPEMETTLASPARVTGRATYQKGKERTLSFLPSDGGGWRIDRRDLPEQFSISVSAENVRTSNRNIELGTGLPANSLRMTEHIIAQRLGLYLDHLILETDSDDPPLFSLGSRPLADAMTAAGIREIPGRPATYLTVTEPVSFIGPDGQSFLTYEPALPGDRKLSLDVAVDFPTAIGRQRIQFDLTPESFLYGAQARTNCSLSQMRFVRYLGWLFPATRHFNYTADTILIAGRDHYVNEPRMIQDGLSLEAVWHRACEDLIAALSLVPAGRLCGKVTSYRAGHTLDCRLVNLLLINNLLASH